MPDLNELKRVPILRHLSDSALEKLQAVGEMREYSTGGTIFVEGQDQGSLFIMLSGQVLISKTTHTGEEKAITTLDAGAFFGEMALFDDSLRSATATAHNNVRALEISREAFMEYLASDAVGASKLMLEIMRAIAPRLRQTNRELIALYDAGRIIGEAAQLGKILSDLLGVLSETTGCTRGVIFLLNTAAGILECRAAFGYDADPSGWTESSEGGIAEGVIQLEEPVRIENFQDNPGFASLQPVGYETPSMLGAALRSRGEAVGIIVLCDKVDRKGKPAQFTSGDANLLAGISAQASGAIESARLHEEAQEREKLDRVYYRY